MSEASSGGVADRYGIRRSRRLDKRVGWTAASIAVVVGLGVIWFSGWQQNTTEIQNIGFTLDKEDTESGIYSATARFEVTAKPGAQVSCTIEALSRSKAVVGWKVIDLPAIETRSQAVSATLITIGPATAVHAKTCWPVEP